MKTKCLSLITLLLLCLGINHSSAENLYYYPMILSCGIIYDHYSDHILTNEEILLLHDSYEALMCGLGETPEGPSTEQEKNP